MAERLDTFIDQADLLGEYSAQVVARREFRIVVLHAREQPLDRFKCHPGSAKHFDPPHGFLFPLMKATDGEGASHILELGGPGTYDRSLRSVASSGKIVQIGVLTGFGPKPDLARLQWENADIIGVTVGSGEHFAAMNRFLADNVIHPIVDRVYGFDEAPEAYAHLRTGSHFGKIVVKL